MSRYADQRRRPDSGGRRGLSSGWCIFLLAAGAAFRFALPAGSYLGINLHVVGVIVFCAGLLALGLPRLAGRPETANLLRRWVIPSGTRHSAENSYGADQQYEQPMTGNLSAEPGRPTLADDLLNAEGDPPL